MGQDCASAKAFKFIYSVSSFNGFSDFYVCFEYEEFTRTQNYCNRLIIWLVFGL